MRRRKKKKHPLNRLFKGGGIALLLLLLAAAVYGWSLSRDIDRRFSGRRWRIPSKVYSDSTILYPGQRLKPAHFLDKLKDLGYREVLFKPQHKGQLRRRGDSLELFLNDLRLPNQRREGFPVKIDLGDGAIAGITDARSGEPVPLLELEPEQLMLFFGPEREQRRLISIYEVPEKVRKAFLAAEDTRFYRHHGIDLRGIARAFYTNLRRGGIYQGGSTITQQLAKNYFLTPEKTFSRKLREMALALVMEIMYEKDEILEIYLNEIYLGQKGSVAVNGLGEASYLYFGKPAGELSLEEGAVIAGLVRGPNLYSPYSHPDRCRQRRDAVLREMAKQGWISGAEYASAVSSPVAPAGFRAYGKKAPFFMDYLADQLRELYSQEDLSGLGLSIFTTIDT